MPRWIDFKALRAKIKIEDLLKSYSVELKVKGDRATAFCPLPGHKKRGEGKPRSPSFSVSLSRNIFQCFSCGAKGNVLDLAAYLEGLDPSDSGQLRQAALKLEERFERPPAPPPEPDAKPNAPKPPRQSSAPALPSEVPRIPGATKPVAAPLKVVVNAPLDFELKHLESKHPYLSSRGFTPETIASFGLGYCAKGMMADRIAIPLHDTDGKLIGYAGRLVDDAKISDQNPKYRFPGTRECKGVTYEFHKSAFLYNDHRIKKPVDDLIVVEGFASVWWLWQHGWGNAVALMGSSVSNKQAQLLLEMLNPDGRLWIMADGDEAGERCASELFRAVAPHRFVRWVKLDAGRQPNDYGPEELTILLPSA